MKHRAQVAHFGRDTGHRKALVRNLVFSLVEHGRIQTTVAKAKELRRHAERAVTLAKKGTLHARRLLLSRFPNEATVDSLIGDLAVRFKNRQGGYTRVLKLGRRPGDSSEMALIEWVDYVLPSKSTEDSDKKVKAPKKAAPKKKTAKKAGSTGAAKKKTTKKAATAD